jgi:hypothetical protein
MSDSDDILMEEDYPLDDDDVPVDSDPVLVHEPGVPAHWLSLREYDESDDDDSDGTAKPVIFPYMHFEPPATFAQVKEIKQIPTAEGTPRTVNSLASLCVSKILSQSMAHHQATTRDFDVNGNEFPVIEDNLERLIRMFLNPTFRTDLDNLKHAAYVLSETSMSTWFPNYAPVVNTIRKYGHILALVAINQPEAKRLALNYVLKCSSPPQQKCFGYPLAFANLPDIAISTCYAIDNRSLQMKDVLLTLILHPFWRQMPLDAHFRAFVHKYMPSFDALLALRL